MDKFLQKYLKENNINYRTHFHKAVFTVKEHINSGVNLPITHTKSLFLKDEKGKFYLVCMDALNRLDIKFLRKHFKVDKLQFGSHEELKKELNLTPGSVSIFGMIYAKHTTLVIDKRIWEAEKVGFHPNINTATLEIRHEDLEKFVKSLSKTYEIINLETLRNK